MTAGLVLNLEGHGRVRAGARDWKHEEGEEGQGEEEEEGEGGGRAGGGGIGVRPWCMVWL